MFCLATVDVNTQLQTDLKRVLESKAVQHHFPDLTLSRHTLLNENSLVHRRFKSGLFTQMDYCLR